MLRLNKGNQAEAGVDLSKKIEDTPADDIGAYKTSVDDAPSAGVINDRALRLMTIGFIVSILANVAFLMLIITILPLQKVVPFMVTFKNQDNQVVSIEPLSIDTPGITYATEDAVRDYVTQRHTVTPDQALMKAQWGPHSRIAARSSQDVLQSFLKSSQDELKQIMTQHYSRQIEINSVSHVTGNVWQVNFTTTDQLASDSLPVAGVAGVSAPVTGGITPITTPGQPGATPAPGTNTVAASGFGSGSDAGVSPISAMTSKQQWVATLRVDYEPQRVNYSDRLLNPLGFTVLDYTVTRRS